MSKWKVYLWTLVAIPAPGILVGHFFFGDSSILMFLLFGVGNLIGYFEGLRYGRAEERQTMQAEAENSIVKLPVSIPGCSPAFTAVRTAIIGNKFTSFEVSVLKYILDCLRVP